MEEIHHLYHAKLLADWLPTVVYLLFAVNVALFAMNLFMAWITRKKLEKKSGEMNLLVVIGSGGHTAEMIKLMASLGNAFHPRTYVLADSDTMSHKKVIEFEESLRSEEQTEKVDEDNVFHLKYIPRSREVNQSYFTAIFTTIAAFFCSLKIVWECRPDVVLCNGPGTGLPICILASLLRRLRLFGTRVLFVESVCRVQTLSLTGRMLYYTGMSDEILVQWPELHQNYPHTKYIGRLV